VPVEPDAEVSRLRALLRDLVTLSAIPGGWSARDPSDVAAGLADALVGLLQLDFGFVRLCDPGSAEAVEVIRGDAWSGFPAWLEGHLGSGAASPGTRIIQDVGAGGSHPSAGIAIPIGVNGEGGMVAAASMRDDFPNESDRLLLSLAANQASVAFQSARTIVERTVELRRSDAGLARLLSEQRALRRVATLAAQQASQAEIFTAIAESTGELLGVEGIGLLRGEEDGSAVIVALWGVVEGYGVGFRVRADEESVTTRVLRTGRAARVDNLDETTGGDWALARSRGIRSVVWSPVIVEGRTWGVMSAGTTGPEPMPADTESRLGEFTELMATAIANSESRARAERLTDAQAALRRIAILVAEEAPLTEVFPKATEEVARLVGDVDCGMCRDEGDGSVVTVAASGHGVLGTQRVGERFPLDGVSLAGRVLREGRCCRIDDYSTTSGTIGERGKKHGICSAAGCPIVVHARTWGMIGVARYDGQPLPPEAETRLAQLAGLLATAIANADARAEIERLAREQAALRRVATLVAEQASSEEVFGAVVEQVGRLLDADGAAMARYVSEDTGCIVASWGREEALPVGIRFPLKHGVTPAFVRDRGVRSVAGAPIVVAGGVWGALLVGSYTPDKWPRDAESKLEEFTQLAATAVSNMQARADLAASRARIVTAADEARRRIERDLHDGIQQRLVSVALTLRATERTVAAGEQPARELAELGAGLDGVIEELRELSRGIHPAILKEGGVGAAIRGLARRSAVPVVLNIALEERLPEPVEVATYYVISEALTNAAKHARASRAEVAVEAHDGALEVSICDDGVGGAHPVPGSGLAGLSDRVEAIGGTIRLSSPPGKGTLLRVSFPRGC
jgi:signal transduction histidine kinase